LKHYPYVILGGGVVAGYAAQAFVAHGLPPGQLCIVSAEPHLPYDRPPLSKAYLAGNVAVVNLLINPPAFYETHGIAVQLATAVEYVDFTQKRLYCQGDSIFYDNLLIATGARAQRLTLPGAELTGIHYLRTLDDADQIRQAAAHAQRAIVIGGGFIGMEVSAVLQALGLATTLVFRSTHLNERIFTTRMAAFFENYYRDCGVTLCAQERVIGFASDNGHVTHVSLASGKDLPTDLVVAGVGIAPNTELFINTPLQVDDGIVINRFLETSIPDVYASGDVACYRDLLYNRLRRVDHWENAVMQGHLAARIMLGQREEYLHVPYLFSRIFDRSYEFWGDAEQAERVVYRGDVESGSFSAWWLSPAGRLLAAFVMERPEDERLLAQQWTQEGRLLNADCLHNAAQVATAADAQ
jgi:NADPH-dependent 2,4-dienoyl-CoA reductase/sulfur reductase-like enzyme